MGSLAACSLGPSLKDSQGGGQPLPAASYLGSSGKRKRGPDSSTDSMSRREPPWQASSQETEPAVALSHVQCIRESLGSNFWEHPEPAHFPPQPLGLRSTLEPLIPSRKNSLTKVVTHRPCEPATGERAQHEMLSGSLTLCCTAPSPSHPRSPAPPRLPYCLVSLPVRAGLSNVIPMLSTHTVSRPTRPKCRGS